jgi:hypothetical protein
MGRAAVVAALVHLLIFCNVPVRLEKRLAALLTDLAAFKRRKHGIDYDSHASYRFVEGL